MPDPMARPNLLESAKQGDPQAIEALLGHSLRSQQIKATVHRQTDCLQIVLESVQRSDPLALVALVQAILVSLDVTCVQRVEVYGQSATGDWPAWMEVFEAWSMTDGMPPPADPFPSPLLECDKRPEAPEFWTTLRMFQLASIFPIRDTLNPKLYNSLTVKLLLFFGLFPLAVDLVVDADNVQQTAWLLGIYYASIWGLVLYGLIAPKQFSWNDTLKCSLFTVFIGVPLLLLVQQVPLFKPLYEAANQLSLLPRLLGFVFGVGLLEELCKALPVYLFLLRQGRIGDPLTASFYGAVSGLGFAIAEGSVYSLQYTFGLEKGELSFGYYVVANTIRFVSLPLFHAILAGIVGYFLGLTAINPSRQGTIIFIGLAIAAILHGLYNTFAGSLFGLAIAGFSVLLFVAYLRRSQHLIEEMRQAELKQQTLTAPSPINNNDS